MAKNDWWFKFEYRKWDDRELRRCRFETQGFWLRVYASMREYDLATVKGTVEDFVRDFGGTPEEVVRSIIDLARTGAADVYIDKVNVTHVTLSTEKVAGVVTLVSRERRSALKVREQTRLRVAKHREKVPVTPDVSEKQQHHSKSKELEKRKEESGREVYTPAEGPASPPPGLKKPETPNGVSNHPAVVVYEEIFGPVPNAAFAKAVASTITDLGLWSMLVAEKSSYDKPHGWILGEYHKRVAESPPAAAAVKPPGKTKTYREILAEDRENERKLNQEHLERLAAENGTTIEEEEEKIRQKYRKPKQTENAA